MYGKGLFINRIRTASGGIVDLIAKQAKRLRLDYMAVKINRGYYGYNYRQLEDGSWVDDYIPALKIALDHVGVSLLGWGSCWLLDGAAEAGKAIERVKKFDLAGYMIDAEAQAKQSLGRKIQSMNYANKINNEADFPVMLCSYRFPTLHRELPWQNLLSCCDYHAPQVYWIHGKDPAKQLERSIKELTTIRKLPFVPAGPMFSEHGWKPTIEEVNEFNQACIDQNCEGVTWWEYDEAQDEGFFPVLESHEWPGTPPKEYTINEKVSILWENHPELHQKSLW
jgi:hypothetical protein